MTEKDYFGVITDPDFKWVLRSSTILNDNKGRFRSLLIQFINDVADNNDDMFFWEMLPFVRFNPSDKEAIAYTTPDERIFMNAPSKKIGEDVKKWYFIYAHECLHQLWETFAVESKIEKEVGSVDRLLLNIASDCVINDYLNYYRKLDYPIDGLISPDYLKSNYGVEYNRLNDTQFSLYMKMMESISDNDKQDLKNKFDGNDEQQSEPGQQGQQGQGQQGQGQQGQGQGRGQDGQDDQNGQGKQGGQGQGQIDDSEDFEDLKKIQSEISGILKKYQNKISGKLGNGFVSKCKSSQKCENPIKMKSDNGNTNWNKKMTERIRNYVKNMVFKKKRLYERTFSRVKRGTMPCAGQPIMAGKKIMENAFDISLAFYIDCSGSMDNTLDNAFKAVYNVTEEIKKTYSHDKMISGTDFLMHAFNDYVKKIDYGKKVRADGGTLPLVKLFEYIEQNTKDVYINTVITDGEFREIDVNKLKSYIKKFDGIFIFVVNNDTNVKLKELETSLPGKFFYISADSDFTIK